MDHNKYMTTGEFARRMGVTVYCKIKLPKVAKQKWTLLQVQIGQSCKGCI